MWLPWQCMELRLHHVRDAHRATLIHWQGMRQGCREMGRSTTFAHWEYASPSVHHRTTNAPHAPQTTFVVSTAPSGCKILLSSTRTLHSCPSHPHLDAWVQDAEDQLMQITKLLGRPSEAVMKRRRFYLQGAPIAPACSGAGPFVRALGGMPPWGRLAVAGYSVVGSYGEVSPMIKSVSPMMMSVSPCAGAL